MFDSEGTAKLLDQFGFVPVFHDGEVLSVVLHRDGVAMTLTLLVPVYRNRAVLDKVEVVLEFLDIETLHLEGFNHQNVISSLTFETVVEKTEYSKEEVQRIHVDLDTVFGMWATFSCSTVHVKSVISIARPTGLRT